MESSFRGQSISSYISNLEGILVELEFWIFKSVPKLVDVISLNPVNSGDSNGGIHASIPTLGDKNQNLPSFCLPLFFLSNPLGESGRIVHRWKGLDEDVAAPLES